MYGDQQVQDQIFLTKQMGLSAGEAKDIQQLGLLNNQNANSLLKTIIKQNDSVISYKKIIADVTKISGQLVAQYQNSPELLARAVVQAEKLGITLEEAKKQSTFLLDFQNSISSEMDAELITGKQLNLERARGLALSGQSAEAAREMMKQVGSLSTYSKLNVIQQDALAKAVGMTGDELTNALRQQEALSKLGVVNKEALVEKYTQLKQNNDLKGLEILQNDILAKQNGDINLKKISQLSLQQRFQESVEKVKELFVSIASGPVLSMLNGIAKFLENTMAVKAVLVGVAGIVAGIATSMIITAAVLNPVQAGIGAAVGAGIAMTALAATKVNDAVVSPQQVHVQQLL